jgi:acetyl-CoA carboxylase biotin carboxyl carrier protein
MGKTKLTKSSANGTKEFAPSASQSSTSSAMKTSEIRDLIEFIATTGLNEVNIETKELKLHVKREPDQKVIKSATPVMAQPIAAPAPAPALTAPAPAPTAATPKPAAAETGSGKKTIDIKSPMIGTFYRSANPDSPVFVSVGDKVSKGQTLCIIEAMKLFNEIESEYSGTIVKVLAENATPVEYDQVLFVVEPD